MKPETWRVRYIRLLENPPGDDAGPEDLQAIQDLVDDKLIRAAVVLDATGEVRGAGGTFRSTLKGRLFVDDQRAILRSKSFAGRFKATWSLFGGLAGVVIGRTLNSMQPISSKRVTAYELSATPILKPATHTPTPDPNLPPHS